MTQPLQITADFNVKKIVRIYNVIKYNNYYYYQRYVYCNNNNNRVIMIKYHML